MFPPAWSSLGEALPDPDTILFSDEPVVGQRAWRILFNDELEPVALASVTYRLRWPARKPTRAHCLWAWARKATWGARPQPHPCPALDHTCGVYAVDCPGRAMAWANPNGLSKPGELRVTGAVALWGRVLRFEHGHRAEYAYPRTVVLPADLPGWLADAHDHETLDFWLSEKYGVDVVAKGV